MPCRLAHPAEHADLLNYQLKRLVNYGGAPAIRLCEGRYGITRSEWRVHRCGSLTVPQGGWAWLDNDGVNAAATALGALGGWVAWRLLS